MSRTMHADEIHHAKAVETELFLGIYLLYSRLTRPDNSAVCTVDAVDAADARVMTCYEPLRLYEVALLRYRPRLLVLGRGFSKKLTSP